ncbi:MAG: lysylphosphatidylglycerol synthase transmembrane domain-containing protein [Edaphobacter sp.]|uniref:lysylphosphatidylglycerol synthase transmembrane domain-containing protein n=1 Tax=Edaphobacter sp. TaxID=1934404 RepID=UPI00239CDB51|nr:lysylphosphatidylglycerol synthase transmembrane domain-containing protein [Edaphobacter sp.]MDE1177895.1 lysylphosphatidylglycerol synthase transmembrane domain-containing protein [Edaphobacter sp.]
MKGRGAALWGVLVGALAVVVFLYRDRIHFDWGTFVEQLKHASPGHLLTAIAMIYFCYWLRAVRWRVIVRPMKEVSVGSLVGPQFTGFTAVALFGRLADLSRPYLVARKINLSLASQVAVYTLERMFDLGAAALVFSSALAFAPKNTPDYATFMKVGRGSLLVTLAIAIFAYVVRVAGGAVAGFARTILKPLSAGIAESIAEKIEGFRDGLKGLKSGRELLVVTLISLTMWGLIALAYVQTAHAFVETPQLANLTFSQTMLLMAASIGGSLLQLPIVGWFTQIAVTATAMHAFYGAPVEAATACGAMLLTVTFLCIIPAGLICARLDHVSLKKLAVESEEAGREVVAAQE